MLVEDGSFMEKHVRENPLKGIINLADQIGKNTSGNFFSENPGLSARLLDTGVDSRVYLINIGEEKICKVYDVSSIKREQIEKYRDYTNQLADHLIKYPYLMKINLGGKEWTIELQAVPIELVAETIDKKPMAISSFCPGRHLEDIFGEINREINDSGDESRVLDSDIGLLSATGEKEEFISKRRFQELFEKTFWLLNRDRLEGQFNQYINKVLETRDFALHPKNIKPFIDTGHNKIIFQITDIGDVLSEIEDVNSD